MYTVYSFAAGLIFGFGLIISQMISPLKVQGFLDVFGRWDPSLALVMAAAVVVTTIAFLFSRKRTATLLGTPMHLPQTRDIDHRLIVGSVVFGIGWGLAGFCPGPALVALGTGHVKAFIFVIAMLSGMAIFEFAERRREQRTAKVAGGLPHMRHPQHLQAAPPKPHSPRRPSRKGG